MGLCCYGCYKTLAWCYAVHCTGRVGDVEDPRVRLDGFRIVDFTTPLKGIYNDMGSSRCILRDWRSVLVGVPSTKPQTHIFWLGSPAPTHRRTNFGWDPKHPSPLENNLNCRLCVHHILEASEKKRSDVIMWGDMVTKGMVLRATYRRHPHPAARW